MNDMEIQFVIPRTSEECEEYFHLRWKLLRAPWEQPPGSEKDVLEDQSFHLFVKLNDMPVAVGRLHFNTELEAQIRYMAVVPKQRKKGIGRMIVLRLEEEARQRKADSIVLNARENSIGFYQKMGFLITGKGHTLFNKIQHVTMRKSLI